LDLASGLVGLEVLALELESIDVFFGELPKNNRMLFDEPSCFPEGVSALGCLTCPTFASVSFGSFSSLELRTTGRFRQSGDEVICTTPS
jgi:hypothetical protein